MARKSSQLSNQIEELTISPAALAQRWPPLVRQLRAQLGLGENDLNVAWYPTPTATIAEFVGAVCEYVERERGGKASVVPFTKIGRGALQSWLGLQEKWEQKAKNLFVFHHVSLTVYLGYSGEVLKPQVFRSEWPGIRDWESSGLSFQSPGAGHPHWQFDAMTTFRERQISQRELSLARLREEPLVQEFEVATLKPDVLLDVRRTALERIHFASAAPWWRKSTSEIYGVHMNAPQTADEIARWIMECITYIRQELARC